MWGDCGHEGRAVSVEVDGEAEERAAPDLAFGQGDDSCDIRIGAQAHLERFYNGFGFTKSSEPYDEDGILHIEMETGK